MAGGLGFEPRLAESESAVLPLDDPPRSLKVKSQNHRLSGNEDLSSVAVTSDQGIYQSA